MSSYVNQLVEKSLIHAPKWLSNNVLFEGLTGSVAYGCSNDTSDMDIVGFCMPPKDVLFPHLRGEIIGFGTPQERFEQFQQHHIKVPEWNKEFDLTIFSIVKFFQLTMENNPNMVDSLFLPRRCVLHSTHIYEHIRDNRKLFLHKGSKHKFSGYAHSQMSKIANKVNSSNPKRAKTIEDFGYDVKFAYHVVRLLLEAEQIMVEYDLDLERNSKILMSIRRGEWSLDQLQEWHQQKQLQLEGVYINSSLQNTPDEKVIKNLLMECIEMHYGSISNAFVKDQGTDALVSELQRLVDKFK
jgi:predicted nucleotidyltransferase